MPAGSWFVPLTPTPLAPLAPGASSSLDFRLAAPVTARLGDVFSAATELRGSDGRGSVALSLQLAVASQPTGTLQVMVVDEYTTYDPAQPLVAPRSAVTRKECVGRVGSTLFIAKAVKWLWVAGARSRRGFARYGWDVSRVGPEHTDEEERCTVPVKGVVSHKRLSLGEGGPRSRRGLGSRASSRPFVRPRSAGVGPQGK